MARKSRKCLSCGRSYDFCPDCIGPDRLAPAWKAEFCCEDCKTLWSTATKFNMGKLTKAEAKAIISALDLKPAEQYVACVQRDLKVILAEEPKPKRTRKSEIKIPEPVAMSTVIEEVTSVAELIPAEEIALVAETSIEVVNQTEEIK